jgi:hypothetical protein
MFRNESSYNLCQVPDNIEDTRKSVITDKSILWRLETDVEGWPILPDANTFSLTEVKDIIRSFLTMIYRESLLFIAEQICNYVVRSYDSE